MCRKSCHVCIMADNLFLVSWYSTILRFLGTWNILQLQPPGLYATCWELRVQCIQHRHGALEGRQGPKSDRWELNGCYDCYDCDVVWTSETIVTFFEVLTSNYGAMEVQNHAIAMQNPILVGRDHRVNHQCHIMYSLSRCLNSGPLWFPPHSAILFAFTTPLPVWEANQQEEHIRVSVVGYFLILSRYKKVWCRCWPLAALKFTYSATCECMPSLCDCKWQVYSVLCWASQLLGQCLAVKWILRRRLLQKNDGLSPKLSFIKNNF